MKKIIFHLAFLCLLSNGLQAQSITQTIRGTVIDKESQSPLIGANVMLIGTDRGASTDLDGSFVLKEVNIGRHDLEVSYLGYEPLYLQNILLKSGKELVLNLEMLESTKTLDEVVVSAAKSIDKTKPLNSFATVSSRTFSVEETSRYAAAAYDPARMAQNYAGVSVGAGDDLFNAIVVRGNSSSGILWRLEGVEIPNPNHFGNIGNSGGAISMLSSTTLSNSDFYTGAFPAEFGNATAGVFDLNMRNGNNEQRETSFMLGALGVELGTEGPLSKKHKGSYLMNYRYSTLALLELVGVNPTGDVLPTYQDLSFKLHLPTDKAGNFSIFGLGGNNLAAQRPEKDSTQWEYNSDRLGFEQRINMGVVGVSHRYLLNDQSYIKTVAISSIENENQTEIRLDDNYESVQYYDQKINQNTFRFSTLYHRKFSPKHSMRIGAIYSNKNFDLNIDERPEIDKAFKNIFTGTGETSYLQAYYQSKFRLGAKTKLNLGLHSTYLGLNEEFTIEPRLALSFKLGKGSELSFASGVHSKVEHLSLYTVNGNFEDGTQAKANPHLKPTKALHNVIAYDHVYTPKLRMKLELYHQMLYDVVISDDPTSTFTILNAVDAWEYFGLSNAKQDGTGRNIGIDVTLERFFADSYYAMFTGSVYDSKYSVGNDVLYNTRFDGEYMSNVIGGKEWEVGKNGKNILGLNGKFVLAGGNRYTKIKLAESILADDEILDWDNPYGEKNDPYYRLDFGISYRINTPKMTHTILFDIQNVTNRNNTHQLEYEEDSMMIEESTHTGLFPFFNYRIEF